MFTSKVVSSKDGNFKVKRAIIGKGELIGREKLGWKLSKLSIEDRKVLDKDTVRNLDRGEKSKYCIVEISCPIAKKEVKEVK